MEGLEKTLPHSTQFPFFPQRTYRKRGRERKKKEKGQINQGIFNLAGVQFTDKELEVLNQGLKFAPNKDVDKFDLLTSKNMSES